jgi:O-antigen/teichoic acid export membrane protein
MSLGIALLTNLDVILVKNVSSPELAGLYGAFNVLAGIVLTINLAVVSVVLPFAAALAEEGNPVPSENILTAYIVIFAVNVLATFVYALWGREIIVILFGAKYAEPSGSLWLLGIVSGLLAFIILEANLAFARGEFKVIYALALTVLAMAITINSWHASIGQVALDLIISFIFGNVFVQIFQRSPSRAPVNI